MAMNSGHVAVSCQGAAVGHEGGPIDSIVYICRPVFSVGSHITCSADSCWIVLVIQP